MEIVGKVETVETLERIERVKVEVEKVEKVLKQQKVEMVEMVAEGYPHSYIKALLYALGSASPGIRQAQRVATAWSIAQRRCKGK